MSKQSTPSFFSFENNDDNANENINENKVLLNKKRANDLNGKTWTNYSISIWSNIKKTDEENSLEHPAIFPLALVTRLIEIFTRRDQQFILDPFAGVGTTILAAQRLNKIGIGIELYEKFAEVANNRLKAKMLFESTDTQSITYCDDSNNLLKYVKPNSIDFVVTSPPYWNILTEKRTADYKEIRNYGEESKDLGRINDYKEFLDGLKRIFEKVFITMREGSYCCVIVMDIRKKDKYYPYHSDIANFMQNIGYIFDDIIIWDRRHEYNNMRPLGYPYVFRVNKAHEYILIFKKPINNELFDGG